MTTLHDPMQLPLEGVRVVEASAGTGKTFTIATLYLRLILERGLLPEEIVVATFTRAATAELSERLRGRVLLADTLLAGDNPAQPAPRDDGAASAVRIAIGRALQAGQPLPELRLHIRKARLALDAAMTGTLHSFCFRALGEFGFETGQALDAPELVEDVRALELEIVRDFWRRGSGNATTAALLTDTWGSPEALAKQACDARWRGRAVAIPEVDTAGLTATFEQARNQIAAWDAAAIDAAKAALAACIDTARTRQDRVALLDNLHAWAQRTPRADTAAAALASAEKLGAKALDAIQPKGMHAEGVVFDDLAALCRAHAAMLEGATGVADLPAARLLGEARAYLADERGMRLAARNLVSHDGAVTRLAAALADPTRGDAAVASMRQRWKAALIDEFQDTDSAQWHVVRRLFADTTLILVGDPKQAIYGFRGGDVYAWREAVAASNQQRLELATSYRSGRGMTRATNALFDRPQAFIEDGFDYAPVKPDAAVAQRALLRDGKPLPGLQVWWLDPERIGHAAGKPPSKDRLRDGIQGACVAWIAGMLADPKVELRGGAGQCTRLRPRDIAVLVNSNDEAAALQAALGHAGVAAASNLRTSVYASDETADLALLLEALAAPDDARRARAAHASILLGDPATALAATTSDAKAQSALLEGVAGWAARVSRHGPLAWLHELIAAAAPRILAWPDGERRIANYLQLAELLQDLAAASFGAADLASRFARARVAAGDDTDSARLRLDTDADAVTVSTVHVAKGLEYAVVLVPYAILAHDPTGHKEAVPLHWHHAGNAARVAIGTATGPEIRAQATAEQAAEDVRKFYVAVTRAQALCVLPWGPGSSAKFGPVHHLLHQCGRDQPLPADATGCRQALDDLCARAGDAVEVIALPASTAAPATAQRSAGGTLAARTFARNNLERDWQTWSFSRLVRSHGAAVQADPAPGAGDDDTAAVPERAAVRPTLAGPRFGTAVHAALERANYAAWLGTTDVPDAERSLLERCLRNEGLPEHGMPMAAAVQQAGACVAAALNAPLACGIRAGELAPDARRAELPFHLALAPASTHRLFELLHQFGYQRVREGVGVDTLHGLLTGVIDLAFQHAGRYYLIDWKTNWCPPYDAAALADAISTHDYDLQWLIYTLALHRWLKHRLANYAYDAHMGGAYYLFVRGLADGHGIHADRPPRVLVEALDTLFDRHAEQPA